MREIERAFAFAIKNQADYDVDAGPTMADDALRLAAPVEIEEDWISDNQAEGEQTGGKGSYPSSERAGRVTIARIRRRLRGTGVAYAAAALPAEHDLLKMILGSHNLDTTLGAEEVSYWGADQGEAVSTFIAQTFNKQYKGLNAVPRSARLTVDAGQHVVLEVEIAGVGLPPVQQALEAATLDTVIPPIFKGAVWTLGGVAMKPITFSLDFGLALSDPVLDGTAGDAWSGHVLTDRVATGTMTVHIQDVAVFDPHARCAAAEQLAWVADFAAGGDYNKIRIEADRLEILKVKPAARGGLGTHELEFKINKAVSPSTKDPLITFYK